MKKALSRMITVTAAALPAIALFIGDAVAAPPPPPPPTPAGNPWVDAALMAGIGGFGAWKVWRMKKAPKTDKKDAE